MTMSNTENHPPDLPDQHAKALAVDGPAAGRLLPRPAYGPTVVYRDMHEGDPTSMPPGLPSYTDHTYWLVRLSFGGRIIYVLSQHLDGLKDRGPAMAAATFYLLSENALACIDDALSLEVSHGDRTA